tara:strand:- start:559 stop:1143 length:585 start_codon:yes stop_codon:yes gene_type:complete
MPGFGRNTRIVAGQALQANAVGSVRQPLTRFSERFDTDTEIQGHKVDVNDPRNNGTPIKVSRFGVEDPGETADRASTCIHVADLSAIDEVYLWASNKGTTNSELTISFVTGGFMINGQQPPDGAVLDALTSDQRIVTVVGARAGLQLVYPGIPHTNNDAIFAMSPNQDVNICGFVMRRFRESAADVAQGFDGRE